MKGKIQKYFSFRGYGFIETDESDDNVFFHVSNFPKYQVPVVGQNVSFNMVETPKGKEATEINIDETSADTIEEQEIGVQEIGVQEIGVQEIGVQEIGVQETASVDQEVEETSPSIGLEQIPGIGPKYEQLLRAAHIKTIQDIAGYAPEILTANLLAVNQEENLTKRPPTLENVKEWIEIARAKSK